jgi:hypothetical protein
MINQRPPSTLQTIASVQHHAPLIRDLFDQIETALLPAPFWCTYAWNRPTLTGARGSDPLWLCWRGKPWLAVQWRGYAASKWSQLERQLILGQRLSPIATSQHRRC